MEKRYLIFNMDTQQYYTGMYYDEEQAWSRDYAMSERFKSIDKIDDIINDDSTDKMESYLFFKEYPYLEIKTIFVKV